MRINHFRTKVATVTIEGKYYSLLEVNGNLAITKPDGSLVRVKKGSLKFRTEKGLNLRQSVKDIVKKTKSTGTECLIISSD